ncbi:restriction endonuclease subunit S [Tetragenococcus halophilus]|uniref:restriction endonuclease subunit S n=1 Tax=Tetragenococcus halophilus TaxID=51669 RepID=UPI0021BB9C9C|nr:restriction endonuclease subunit S [Tetragenococcus halophilus]MCT8310084.1 restriction endonuclease subunit S [Tetragenococcus halophilus]GMQ72965.1 restriction endonuclease subunit S [Tetragenococcus halophilus]
MSKEEKRVPEVRFEGFYDDWKQRKLGEIFQQTSKYINPKETDTDLWSLTIKDGLTPKTDRYQRGFLIKKKDKFKKAMPRDFVYNPMNMTLGAIGYNNTGKAIAVSGYYVTMFSNDLVNDYYINTWMQTTQALNLYKRYATGSLLEKQRVQFPTLSLIPFKMPKIKEQKNIGEFFNQLNNLIALHQRKLEQLRELKKAALQYLFPKKDEAEPKVRFANFMDDRWSSYKIKDIFLERLEKSGEGELISVTINSGVVKASELDRKDNSSLNKTNYKSVKRHDIAYNSMRMWQGASGYSPYNGIVSPAYTVITPKQGINSKFFSFMFKKNEMIQAFKRNSQGLTSDTWNLKFPVLSSIKVKVPKTEEQDKIEQYMNNLDNIIKLYQGKLENFQDTKKAFLQKMFI